MGNVNIYKKYRNPAFRFLFAALTDIATKILNILFYIGKDNSEIIEQMINIMIRSETNMTSSSNNIMNPNARDAMDKFKMEAAAEVGVNLKQGYNGDLTSRQAGSVGGQMVKKMIQAYENGMK